MYFELHKPCNNCPFLKDSTKAVRLHKERAKDIGEMMISDQGGSFTCHKTGKLTSDAKSEQHCAGAIAFALKNGNLTQSMRLAERLQLLNISDYEDIDPDTIIDTPSDMAFPEIKKENA